MKLIRALLFLTISAAAALGQLSQGPNGPTVTAGGWANPTYIFVRDGQYASKSILPSSNSANNVTKGFGFTVPAGALIQGIVVTVYRSDLTGFGDLSDYTVQLQSGGVAIGNNKAALGLWLPGPSTATYGSPTDVWGVSSPMGATVDDSSFGLTIAVHNQNSDASETAGLDYVSITVYYQAGAAHAFGSIVGEATKFKLPGVPAGKETR